MKAIGIIGSGTMGSGIAQVAATAGCQVKVFDSDPTAADRAAVKLNKIYARLVEKGRITSGESTEILGRIDYVSALEELENSELVIEAIVENLEIKQQVLSELEPYLEKTAIIASNTSSLSIASIAASLTRPERCLGIHFFNPPALMKLVEVVPAVQTHKAVLKNAADLMEAWGKTVVIAKDTPGFIVNRVARPFYGEALRILEEGIADEQSIDAVMTEDLGFRMGPFQLMDFIGNDVNYAVTESVFKAFYYDSRYKPAFTQKRLVEAGFLGKKSGKGYYQYDETGNTINTSAVVTDQNLRRIIADRILVMLINEAADALYLNIASAEDIDKAMTNGVNYPKGLLRWADEKGIDWCVSRLDDLFETYREERYRCSPLLRKMKSENKRFF